LAKRLSQAEADARIFRALNVCMICGRTRTNDDQNCVCGAHWSWVTQVHPSWRRRHVSVEAHQP